MLSTITGRAPLSCASTRYRSSRRGLKSASSAVTSSTTSTFAATTCSATTLPATFRTKRLLRSRTPWIVARSESGSSLIATQSPTAG